MKVQEALKELRREDKRKFDQTVDLIINLRGIDLKRESINTIANLPHVVKEKKVCGFFTKKSGLLETIPEPEFQKYKDKKALKRLAKEYDYFIAIATLMPKVATIFGKVLGPLGKMPSPQLGILMDEKDEAIQQMLEKINHSLKIRIKEASVKMSIGKESMGDEILEQNIAAVYHAIVNVLPKKTENIRSIMIKFTMTKTIKVEVI